MQDFPPEKLDGFPTRRYTKGFYRAAREEPWWFCTCGGCRFDLEADDPSGLGTLYAGSEPITGVIEMIGPEMNERPIACTFLAERIIWILGYDRAIHLANLCHDDGSGFGVTNELSTMVPYDVPQAWAQALAEEGMDGINYRTRFSTGEAGTGIALFDQAGAQDWVAVSYCRADDQEIIASLMLRHIHIEDIPFSDALDVIA